MPSQAYREWLRLPVGMMERIIEARAYAATKAQYDSAETAAARARLPHQALLELVQLHDFALAQEALDRETP